MMLWSGSWVGLSWVISLLQWCWQRSPNSIELVERTCPEYLRWFHSHILLTTWVESWDCWVECPLVASPTEWSQKSQISYMAQAFKREHFKRQEVATARLEVLSITLPSTCHQSSPRTQSGFKERGLLVGELSRSFAHPFLPQGSQVHQPYSQAGTQGNWLI